MTYTCISPYTRDALLGLVEASVVNIQDIPATIGAHTTDGILDICEVRLERRVRKTWMHNHPYLGGLGVTILSSQEPGESSKHRVCDWLTLPPPIRATCQICIGDVPYAVRHSCIELE